MDSHRAIRRIRNVFIIIKPFTQNSAWWQCQVQMLSQGEATEEHTLTKRAEDLSFAQRSYSSMHDLHCIILQYTGTARTGQQASLGTAIRNG